MITKYYDELLCDLAEYYHIYDMKQFPMEYIAVLSCGLPETARVIKAISNRDYTTEQMLTALAVDKLSLLWWAKTKDGQKNRNRPQLFSEILLHSKEKADAKQNLTVFNSAEEFEQMRMRIIGEKNG